MFLFDKIINQYKGKKEIINDKKNLQEKIENKINIFII